MERKGVVHVEGGFVFTDGSGFYIDIPYGWPVVVYDHERRRVARYYGAVPKDMCPPASSQVWRGLRDVDC
eukprot:4214076-Pyramimonas_sp.AAC.1